MKKIIILFISILFVQNIHAIGIVDKNKIEIVTEKNKEIAVQDDAAKIINTTINTTPEPIIAAPTKKESFWKKCKRTMLGLIIGDDEGYDIMGMVSLGLLIAALIFLIIAVGVAISSVTGGGIALIGTAYTLALIAGVLSVGSFVTGIIGLVKYLKDPEAYKGKGILFTSLGIWLIYLLNALLNRN